MTAFALKLASATFNTSLKGLRLPSRRKLVGEYVLGGSQAESIKNRANPSAPLTVDTTFGAPTYNANSVTVRSSTTAGYGFSTGIVPADDSTLIVVRKNAAIASACHVVMDAGNRFGMRQFNGASNYAANGEGVDNQGANRATPASGATVYFEALVMSRQNPQLVTGGLGTLYYYAAGVQTTAVSANINATARRSMASSQICIGGTNLTDTITNNTQEVFFVALYQRSLSAAEITAAYNAIVAYYAALGVTVV